MEKDHDRGRGARVALLAVAVALTAGCSLFGTEEPPTPTPPASDSARAAARDSARADSVAAARADSLRRARARADSVRRADSLQAVREALRDSVARVRREEARRDSVRRAREEWLRTFEPGSPTRGYDGPPPLPGSILPRERIVAFYGHAGSRNMGILGELPPDQMLARLDEEVRAWEEADPTTPVRPALQVITTMASGAPGPDSLYRVRMPDRLIERVMGWARRRDALVILDIQPGRSTVAAELPRLEKWLVRPNVHLALDPEWNMGPDQVPGRSIGSMRAEDVNLAIHYLADLVTRHHLPPKVLVVHRFTEHMLPNPEDIELDPRVQLVVNMDGWGPPAQKLGTYRSIVAPQVPQYSGFKLFFKNDRRDGSRLLTPEELLVLNPVPMYIQYQ